MIGERRLFFLPDHDIEALGHIIKFHITKNIILSTTNNKTRERNSQSYKGEAIYSGNDKNRAKKWVLPAKK